jgi:hypothetical protein
MVHLTCPKRGETMSNNKPIDMMGFIDFTIFPDGKIKVNRSWSSPKNKEQQASKTKKISEFKGVEKSGGGIEL